MTRNAAALARSVAQHRFLRPRRWIETFRSDFFAINGDFAGSFDADSDLIPIDLHHRDSNVLTNDDFLTQLPAQNQHGHLPVDMRYKIICFPSTPSGFRVDLMSISRAGLLEASVDCS